jgi:cell division protein FtsI (penicillin-binding protein 3)
MNAFRERAIAFVRWLDHSLRPRGGAVVTRARIGLVILAFIGVYAVIGGRLVYLGFLPVEQAARKARASDAVSASRPDILDREGRLLASDIKTPSLFANPRRIQRSVGVDEAMELITAVLPDLDNAETRERLSTQRRFVWLKREITPKQQDELFRQGIPGIGFLRESRRIYPAGTEAAHVLGHVNLANAGAAGIERWIDSGGLAELHQAGLASGRALEPVELSLDMAAQHALRDELLAAREKYKALAATGLLLDVRSGEVIALSSLPDFDPNKPGKLETNQLNRMTTAAFEMGSTFKALTVAMALDSGMAQLTSIFNAREPLKYGNFTIDDFHAQRRALTVPEIFIHSSNIGSAKMALAVGVEGHKNFLRKMGQLERLRTELPEGTDPLVPKHWSELSTVTIAFGHGLSVAPLQAAMATAALVNGGKLITPTFLKRSEEDAKLVAKQVIKPETSDKMRYLMRLNVEQGTAKRAEVEGFYVGGKTGTSEKVERGRYVKNKLLTSFMGVFPADQPKYLLLVMLDEPQATVESKGQATSGHNAVPVAGRIIARVAPLLGLKPRDGLPVADRLLTPGRQAAN